MSSAYSRHRSRNSPHKKDIRGYVHPRAAPAPHTWANFHPNLAAFISSRLKPGRAWYTPPLKDVFVRKLNLKVITVAGIGATLVALVSPIVMGGTAASAASATKPTTTVLVPVAAAKAAGFTTAVDAPTASTSTGVTGCPYGAQEEFAATTGNLQLISEVLFCKTVGDASTLLKSVKSNGQAQPGLSPPKALGSTAVERLGSNSTYLIAWRRGSAFELTGISTGSSSTSTSTSTTAPTVPLSASGQQDLVKAATEQNMRFVTVTVSSSGSTATGSKADAKAQATANAAAVAAGCPKSPATVLKKSKWSSAPAMTINAAKTYTATVKTDLGTFVIALDAKSDPITVNNFVFLAQHKFYDCVIFHRVIPGFVDQTGDPTGTGSGGPGYTITDELPAKASNAADQYPLGSVAMANTGQPNTGGSQWFVIAGAQGESLPNSYSLFGHVTSGMSVVKKINAQGSASGVPPDVTHRMLKVTITSS
jgi:cyclophilin family peptidyl-prolyl cis-trans isomerase